MAATGGDRDRDRQTGSRDVHPASLACQAARRIGVLPVGGIDGGDGGVDSTVIFTTRSCGTVARLTLGVGLEHTSVSEGRRMAAIDTRRGMNVGMRGGAGSAVGIEAGPASPSSIAVSFAVVVDSISIEKG